MNICITFSQTNDWFKKSLVDTMPANALVMQGTRALKSKIVTTSEKHVLVFLDGEFQKHALFYNHEMIYISTMYILFSYQFSI